MTEDLFWQIIDHAREEQDFYGTLSKALHGLSGEEIITFQNLLLSRIASANNFPLLAANFVIQSYVSDDVFEEFRAWLITQGKERFESSVNDPESICDWLTRDDADNINGEYMLAICLEAYSKHGGEDEYYSKLHYPRVPDIDLNWPDSKNAFAELYPRLVSQFWNQTRINELHTD